MKMRDLVDRVSIDLNKLVKYALDFNHPEGKDKAQMFKDHLGFTSDNYQALLDQIEANILDAEIIRGYKDGYGQRYTADLVIIGVEEGQKEVVRTGWIVRPDEDFASLITLFIPSRK